jgi:uncharacterized metal-binding protein
MAEKKAAGIHCGDCRAQECLKYYPEGIPGYCLASREDKTLKLAAQEYEKPGIRELYLASGKVYAAGYGNWNRFKEAIEFGRALGVKKIGFAACGMLMAELQLACELFRGAGFEVVGVNCQVGRVPPGDRLPGVEGEAAKGLWCNPIAQAMIVNELGSELNFIIGLCLGHDMLFARYARAPVSTLVVKDRVLGHNSVAALTTQPARALLWREYCGGVKR